MQFVDFIGHKENCNNPTEHARIIRLRPKVVKHLLGPEKNYLPCHDWMQGRR